MISRIVKVTEVRVPATAGPVKSLMSSVSVSGPSTTPSVLVDTVTSMDGVPVDPVRNVNSLAGPVKSV